MPEDPKDIFRRVVAKKEADRLAAAAEAQRAAQRKAERDRAVRMSRQPPPEDDETEASQWVRENLVWEPYPSLWCLPFCSWSDYSDSIVERSNGKALMRDFPDLFQEGHGGHGTVWVGFTDEKRRALTDDVWSSLQDIARGLADYPLYDEDLHSAMEQESQWECQQSNATFKRLQQQLADRPELHQRLADLGTKMDRSTQLIAKLRYSMEFRHELKRMALKPEEITGLVPARSTPWGQRPLFVIGVKDQEGREHTFQRPIRVQR